MSAQKKSVSDRRPWGSYVVLCSGSGYQVKRIEIKPGRRFSLQRHFKRDETWVIVEGGGVATVKHKKIKIKTGDVLRVPRKVLHRLHNTGKKILALIEVQFGGYLGEDDIERIEDDFGRS